MGNLISSGLGGDPRLMAMPGAYDLCARSGTLVLVNGGPYTLIAFNTSDHSTSIGDTLVLSPAVGNPEDANLPLLAVSSPFSRCFRPIR